MEKGEDWYHLPFTREHLSILLDYVEILCIESIELTKCIE